MDLQQARNGHKETILRVESLSIAYSTRRGDVNAVRDVSFELHRGEALGLVGESGCGKSTTALALMGYLGSNARVTAGRVLFDGRNVLAMNENELQSLRGNHMAMVYQDPMVTLNPCLTIGDQMTEVLTVHQGMSAAQARTHCLDALNRVNMPDPAEVLTRYPHQISGGQQQRILIATALLCNPSLLIMDEPTTALDVTVAATVLDLIASLRSELDSAILYISHNLGVVARICDRVAVMYAGELVEEADVMDLFKSPAHPYSKSLLACVPTLTAGKESVTLSAIPGQVPAPNKLPPGCIFEPRCAFSDHAECRSTHPFLNGAGVRRWVRCLRWPEVIRSPLPQQDEDAGAPLAITDRAQRPPVLLAADDLETSYVQKAGWLERLTTGRGTRRVRAVNHVSFRLGPGQILGVVGESGCGKTSLAKTVAGLVEPGAGKLEFLGVDITKAVEKRDRRVLRELQMVFQNPDSTLNPTQTVYQIIARPLAVSKAVPHDGIEDEVVRLLYAVKLNESYLDRKPGQLSGGEKQRVAIARAFASRPELVICDEPVSSLDVSVQSSVLKTLLRIQEQYGTSLIFISHDLSVVRYLCDYILVMYLGKVMEFGPTERIFQPPYHPYTEALLSAVPVPDPAAQQRRIRLQGAVPSVLNPPGGCPFHTRCPRCTDQSQCSHDAPPAQDAGDGLLIYCGTPLAQLAAVQPVVQATASRAGAGERP